MRGRRRRRVANTSRQQNVPKIKLTCDSLPIRGVVYSRLTQTPCSSDREINGSPLTVAVYLRTVTGLNRPRGIAFKHMIVTAWGINKVSIFDINGQIQSLGRMVTDDITQIKLIVTDNNYLCEQRTQNAEDQ